MSQRNRTKLNTRFTIVVLLSMLGQSVSPLTGFPSSSATPIQSAAPVERPQTVTAVQWLLTAPNTLQITAAGFQPDMVQVTAGQVITITNQDTRARTISFSGAALYKIFLPLIRRNGPALANTTEVAALASSGDLITLSTGQSVTRTFNLAGNVTVNDAENPTVKATILVTPLPLATEGSLEGIVLDYKTKLPIAGARAKALDTGFEAAADSNGRYRLSLPGGDYTLVVFANGYSFANRKVTVQSYTPTGVDTVELVPLDSSVTPIGGAGGVVTNSIGNTNVFVAASAVTSTKALRLTWLPVDAQTGDFSALPGPFTDGNMPIGFVMFEPDGTQFSAPVTWTIEYTGDLPVGMLVPCYYWIESEARWGDPVDGRVVSLGIGKKGLQAVLPHFSSYGFAPPPPPIPDPPQNPPEAPVDPTEPAGPEDNPEGPNNNCDTGSQINLMSGELCQTVGTLSLPTVGALPTQITAKYHSLNATSTRVISTAFGPASGQLTPQTSWTFYIAGRVFSGAGKQPYIEWDGRDANGVLLPPGAHAGTLTAYWAYDYGYMNCSFPTPPNCRQVYMISRFASSTPWFVQVRRNDLSPWGLGWFGPHDMLLVDRGDTVSFMQGDGRQVSFAREISGTYRSPKSDFSVLAKQPGGDWTRTFKDGSVFTFNADGRLTRIADRNGNAQVILYESNGKTVPDGGWGLTTRIRRVLDSSGNQWDYAYDANGRLAGITDSAGRVLRLTHDASGRLTGVTDPLNQTETFTYAANGLMTGHTDRRGFTTNYALDARGRVVTRAWPTGTSLQMSYDPSQVSMLTDRGTPLVTTLDDNYSPIQRYNGVYTMTTTYNSDLLPASQDTPPQQTLYDAQGNVINMFTARHTAFDYAGPYQQVSRRAASDGVDTRFERDGAGNLTQVTDALGQSYQMSYDAQGQLLSITDPLGHVTSFERDARGQVTRVTDPLNRAFAFTYDAAGNRITSRDPLSRTTGLEYDALSHLTAVVDALNGRASITYDANGNVTRIVDQTARPITYAYDALNRVTGVTYADGGTNAYTYDGSGNVIGMADARALTRTFAYDAAGRLTQRQVQGGLTTAYIYDRYDQLTSAADGVLTRTYSYAASTVGYPLRVQQQAVGLPISATVNYQYSNGQVRMAGTSPLAAVAGSPAVELRAERVSVGDVPQTESGTLGAQAPVSISDVLQTRSGAFVPNAPTSVAPRPASFSEPETPAQSTVALLPLWSAAPAAVTCASIANGNWSNPAIWSCGAVPTDTAVIDGEQVTVDVSPTLRSLVFESGALGSSGVHTIDVTETLVFTTSALKSVNGSLQINNAGTGLWTGGDIGGNGGPVLNNLAGAVFDISADGFSMYVSGGGGQATFNNLGTLVKSTGSGNVTIGGGQGWTLYNDGLVQVLTGTLTVGDDLRVGTSTGEF
ncbi:MAG: carboxypeptidase-like regulatory domain-containing protein, partial [Thermoflexales bacterium]|nr:carboxypeptidase-like regulatory domain-containing protein [Thermoflexales bacterium]